VREGNREFSSEARVAGCRYAMHQRGPILGRGSPFGRGVVPWATAGCRRSGDGRASGGRGWGGVRRTAECGAGSEEVGG